MEGKAGKIGNANLSPLASCEVAERFAPKKPLMTSTEVAMEAARCLFCHDAPCINACPTSIDIPLFIRQLHGKSPSGAAKTILTQNILGHSCGVVCPTEVLCEGACVYTAANKKAIEIGRLQAYATDHALTTGKRYFNKGQPQGKKIAVVGAGPAGLACAHEASVLGYDVDVFEASPKAGGLNMYGVAPYKLNNEQADAEVAYIQGIGFNIHTNTPISVGDAAGGGKSLAELEQSYDAIFLGLGLAASKELDVPGADLPGVLKATDFIADLRTKDMRLPVGERVVVIGTGNTAMDAAIETAKLGAEVVVLSRGAKGKQRAYDFEVAYAKDHGVRFIYQAKPSKVLGEKAVEGLCYIDARGAEISRPCDWIVLAIGQERFASFFGAISGIQLDDGKVAVNASFQTGNPKYFAGGDCVNGGKEVVNAVAHGRDAARGIHRYLSGQR